MPPPLASSGHPPVFELDCRGVAVGDRREGAGRRAARPRRPAGDVARAAAGGGGAGGSPARAGGARGQRTS